MSHKYTPEYLRKLSIAEQHLLAELRFEGETSDHEEIRSLEPLEDGRYHTFVVYGACKGSDWAYDRTIPTEVFDQTPEEWEAGFRWNKRLREATDRLGELAQRKAEYQKYLQLKAKFEVG